MQYEMAFGELVSTATFRMAVLRSVFLSAPLVSIDLGLARTQVKCPLLAGFCLSDRPLSANSVYLTIRAYPKS